jgi:hypothetical protein
MRDIRRPPAHPLIELVHDLRSAMVEAEHGGPGVTAARARLYGAMHGTLRSVRRFVDALELLVAEIEAQAGNGADQPDNEGEVEDGDFQQIRVQ